MAAPKNIFLWLMAFLFLAGSCEEQIDPDAIAYENLLVVEGLLTDQPEKQIIKLSRTRPLNTTGRTGETEATVQVKSGDGSLQDFSEEGPGLYRSVHAFKAEPDTPYQLLITTKAGRAYASDQVVLTPTPPIDSVYATFTKHDPQGNGRFSFFFDVKSNNTGTRFFRWTWRETYRIKVSNPSRWKWLGGNEFEFRDESIPELQQEYCFRADSSNQILTGSTELESGLIIRQPIHAFESLTNKIKLRYLLQITQYGLSEVARSYWQAIENNTQKQGSLFDEQPGTIRGNIYSLSDPSETVPGIFEVAEKKMAELYVIPSDFYNQGYLVTDYNWTNCGNFPIVVPTEEAGAYMQANNDRYELLYYSTGGPVPPGAVFGLRRCALCTLYGTNMEPEFWRKQ